MAKKTERKKLDEELIRLFSLCVRARDKTCRYCGSDYRLQAHHVIQRTYKLGRYNPDNGITLCSGCHFHEKTNHEKFRDMIIEILGQKKFDTMKAAYMRTWKWSVPEMKELLIGLKGVLVQLEGDMGEVNWRKRGRT